MDSPVIMRRIVFDSYLYPSFRHFSISNLLANDCSIAVNHCVVLCEVHIMHGVMEDLEKTYSREQQRLGNEQELNVPTTPLSLVRSLTQGNSFVRLHVPALSCC